MGDDKKKAKGFEYAMNFVYSAEVEKALENEENLRKNPPEPETEEEEEEYWPWKGKRKRKKRKKVDDKIQIDSINKIYDEMISMGQSLEKMREEQENEGSKEKGKRVAESRTGRK